MKFVLSGEGPTDIGKIDYATRSFDPGPMAYFIDAVVREKTGVSPLETLSTDGNVIHFIHKTELSDQEINKKAVLPGKKSPLGTAYFIKNSRALGHIAKEIASKTGSPTIAVLFRDADPTRAQDTYEDKWRSMIIGFKQAGFDRGVPMIPRQIMEAWLLDSLDWQGKSHPDFDTVIGGRHSAYPYKKQVSELVGQTDQHNLVDQVLNSTFDQSRITSDSYKRFKARLEDVLVTPDRDSK
ncbi:MAG: hypothetical protein JEY71_13645 [Sphaerochaeta sp.]|nr:hypothetical protein [Sphaerochaeta sp.]